MCTHVGMMCTQDEIAGFGAFLHIRLLLLLVCHWFAAYFASKIPLACARKLLYLYVYGPTGQNLDQDLDQHFDGPHSWPR
jgi:hypothetical protein